MAHKTVTVQPRDDGRDFQQSWETKTSTGKYDASTTKQAARKQAREWANKGDTLVMKKTNGQIQSGYPRTYSGSHGGSENQDRFGIPGLGKSDDYGEGTMDSAFPW